MITEILFWLLFAFVALISIGSVITIAITIVGGLMGWIFGVGGVIMITLALICILKDIFR